MKRLLVKYNLIKDVKDNLYISPSFNLFQKIEEVRRNYFDNKKINLNHIIVFSFKRFSNKIKKWGLDLIIELQKYNGSDFEEESEGISFLLIKSV